MAVVGYITITILSLAQPVYNGPVQDRALYVSPDKIHWAEFSAPPCSEGNAVIYGERTTVFRGIEAVKAGDSIRMDGLEGEGCAYRVVGVVITGKTDIKWMMPATDGRLTLITCEGPGDLRRVIVAIRVH